MVEMRRAMMGLVVVGVIGMTGCGSASNSTPVADSTGSTVSSASVAGSVSGPALNTPSAPNTSSAPNTPSTPVSAGTPSTSSTLSSPTRTASGTASTSTSMTPVTSGGATSPFGATGSRKPGARLTLTGMVESGVEASCLVLEDEKTGLRVNITGGEKAVVRVGARITVVGQLRNDLMSYCQQGPVFVVIKAMPA